MFATRTVCYVEREAFAASQLVALMAAQCLDAAPVWSDLATFDARPWRGIVDCVVAGLPCQPYSVAGKRRGNDDERARGTDESGPIVHATRIIAECEPAVVLLENVPDWVRNRRQWFRPFGEELCRLGYEIEDPLFLAASDVGASHRRERVWIMAYEPGRGQRVLRESSRLGWGRTERSGGELANAEGNGRPRRGLHEPARWLEETDARGSNGAVADAGCRDRNVESLSITECVDAAGDSEGGGTLDDPAGARRSGRESGPREALRDEARCGESGGRRDVVGDTNGTDDAGGGSRVTRKDGRSRLDMLDWQAEMWPTPMAAEAHTRPQQFGRGNPNLEAAVSLRPVHSVIDGRELSPTHRTLRPQLNPAFAAWLMGLPGWWTSPAVTSSVQSEMAAYRSTLQSRSAHLLDESFAE